MKTMCVSIAKTGVGEDVLTSYLKRNCGAIVVEKKTRNVIRFSEENLILKNSWTISQFKNFCEMVVSHKTSLKTYKAKIK